jgi:hypothetical protein
MVAAEAHRWAFLAALEAGMAGPGGALCVETRLVAVKFSQQYSTVEEGVTFPMTLHSCSRPKLGQRNPRFGEPPPVPDKK